MGVPWDQAVTAGSLMGIKTVLNELIAYLELAKLPAGALDDRSRLIMLYAMCGFANFGSLGIMIAGLDGDGAGAARRHHLARRQIDRLGHAHDLPDGRDRRGIELRRHRPAGSDNSELQYQVVGNWERDNIFSSGDGISPQTDWRRQCA